MLSYQRVLPFLDNFFLGLQSFQYEIRYKIVELG